MFARLLVVLLLAAPLASGLARASEVGSGNTVVITPPIPHPDETPCAVVLYHRAQFGADPANFTYTPPAACPGPWAKVILQVQVSLDAGVQFDRTGTLWIGGVNLWFGTTAEPGSTLAPHWHIERDVTDYTSLLLQPHPGFALIANYQSPIYTSTITSNARLLFYPANAQYKAPRTPDVIVPLAAPGGGTVALNTGTDQLAVTQTLPRNIERAALVSYLQGQSGDEFWYTCVPDDLTGVLESCGGTAFREGQVAIDGQPAGVAPIYPWIFTGGIDPYLWFPIPGVQTLDFSPFRVELSPFAGLLSNGSPHTIAVSAYGANNYFSATANLFLYLDQGTTQVTGGITRNTLAAPAPVITPTVHTSGSTTTAHVRTLSSHDYVISGTVGTSHGIVTSTVEQTARFVNDQGFRITDTDYAQTIGQDTKIVTRTRESGGGHTQSTVAERDWPLGLRILEKARANGNIGQKTTVRQGLLFEREARVDGAPVAAERYEEEVAPTDSLLFNSQFQVIGHAHQSSTAFFRGESTRDGCYDRTLAAVGNVLTLDSVSRACR